jgi:hypothetical protein
MVRYLPAPRLRQAGLTMIGKSFVLRYRRAHTLDAINPTNAINSINPMNAKNALFQRIAQEGKKAWMGSLAHMV